ncbi:MAG: hypothetical protein ACFFB5_20105 [Promethearchaeota archaeon]
MEKLYGNSNHWIRNKIIHPKQFVKDISAQVNQGNYLSFEVQPNFYFRQGDLHIFGWISDNDKDDQLFVGIGRKESWILAICDD